MRIYKKNIGHYVMLSFEINEMNIPFTGQIVVKEDNPVVREVILERAEKIDRWLQLVNQIFSPYRRDSELVSFQNQSLRLASTSKFFQEIFVLSAWASDITSGLFSAAFAGKYDPTGIVKGWAIQKAEKTYLESLLSDPTFVAVNLNGGGDMQFSTSPNTDWRWQIGIVDPFDSKKVVNHFSMKKGAVATSGTSRRGAHLFDSATKQAVLGRDSNIISASIIGSELIYVDIWATAIATTTVHDHDWLKSLSGSGLRISYNGTAERWIDHQLIDQRNLTHA
ncbi:FAD:protein FMN transferase [Oenococcus kitaharae]|uniref:FAD:protein FMN transferase n=1 Tax=Oenococcus TaxID=46254 RepID=UPI0021E7B097|nr:FAD:protein FMN transferase [Oenococcus kitaharae]MCV3296163.1 FAD:protein FMN transferase [Oenococcus kitaharae]